MPLFSSRKEFDQLRSDFIARIESAERTFVDEIRRLYTPSEISQVSVTLTNRMLEVERALTREIQRLQSSIDTLTNLVAQISPVTPSGDQKPIHDKIKAVTNQAKASIITVEQVHASWLDQQLQTLKEAEQAISTSHQRIKDSIGHVSIDEKKETA